MWANQRWRTAYSNLFFFSGFYVALSLLIGLALAIAIDQRVKGEAIWRTIFLYPLGVDMSHACLFDPTDETLIPRAAA